MSPSRLRMILVLTFLATATLGGGCGHRRQIVYPARPGGPARVDASRGVHVRAPFVDVHVPAREPGLDLDDDDDDDDRDD